MMTITSLIWLIRRHYVSALAAKSSAIIGLTMTIATIVTGSLWGSSTWGTYWVWDPRLTSFVVLTVLLCGIYSFYGRAIRTLRKSECYIFILYIRSVFALLSRYIVFFIDQGLHIKAQLCHSTKKRILTTAIIFLLF